LECEGSRKKGRKKKLSASPPTWEKPRKGKPAVVANVGKGACVTPKEVPEKRGGLGPGKRSKKTHSQSRRQRNPAGKKRNLRRGFGRGPNKRGRTARKQRNGAKGGSVVRTSGKEKGFARRGKVRLL